MKQKTIIKAKLIEGIEMHGMPPKENLIDLLMYETGEAMIAGAIPDDASSAVLLKVKERHTIVVMNDEGLPLTTIGGNLNMSVSSQTLMGESIVEELKPEGRVLLGMEHIPASLLFSGLWKLQDGSVMIEFFKSIGNITAVLFKFGDLTSDWLVRIQDHQGFETWQHRATLEQESMLHPTMGENIKKMLTSVEVLMRQAGIYENESR